MIGLRALPDLILRDLRLCLLTTEALVPVSESGTSALLVSASWYEQELEAFLSLFKFNLP